MTISIRQNNQVYYNSYSHFYNHKTGKYTFRQFLTIILTGLIINGRPFFFSRKVFEVGLDYVLAFFIVSWCFDQNPWEVISCKDGNVGMNFLTAPLGYFSLEYLLKGCIYPGPCLSDIFSTWVTDKRGKGCRVLRNS